MSVSADHMNLLSSGKGIHDSFHSYHSPITVSECVFHFALCSSQWQKKTIKWLVINFNHKRISELDSTCIISLNTLRMIKYSSDFGLHMCDCYTSCNAGSQLMC